jgi:hypothetical protein
MLYTYICGIFYLDNKDNKFLTNINFKQIQKKTKKKNQLLILLISHNSSTDSTHQLTLLNISLLYFP